jgi:GntR family transcriptional regulator, rspAB operon transcriptional repressor
VKIAAARSDVGRFIIDRRATITQQAFRYLRREIIDGRLLPRAPLSEQELAQRLGVSRTPVREALIKLANEGLVDIYPQFGTFVAPIKLAEVFDSQFIRESLECAAIERAVERIDATQATALQRILDSQRAYQRAGERQAFFQADEDMHALLVSIAGHGTVWSIIQNAKAQMDRVRHLSIRSELKLSAIVAEHTAIIDRVVHRDREGALAAMRAHLHGLFRSVEMLAQENRQYFAAEGEGAPRRAARAGKARAR